MQDELSTVQSLVVLMQERQQHSSTFDYEVFEDAYFKAASKRAQERGLTTIVFIEQRLSAWRLATEFNQMRESPIRHQGIQPNLGGSQGVQQQLVSDLAGHRSRNSPEGQPCPQRSDLFRYLNFGEPAINRLHYESQADRQQSPILQLSNYDSHSRRDRIRQNLEPNQVIEFEEDQMNQFCSFNLSEMSCVPQKQEPLVLPNESPNKTSLKSYSNRIKNQIKYAAVKPNASPSLSQHFREVQVGPQAQNIRYSQGNRYLKAYEETVESQHAMRNAVQSNLADSYQSMLLDESGVNLSSILNNRVSHQDASISERSRKPKQQNSSVTL